MKVDFVADTNFLVYLHEGQTFVEPFLAYDFGISFITEIELLGFKGITKLEVNRLKRLIDDCFLLEWSPTVKTQTILLKQKYKIKLPDAIIAATCLV